MSVLESKIIEKLKSCENSVLSFRESLEKKQMLTSESFHYQFLKGRLTVLVEVAELLGLDVSEYDYINKL